MYTHRIMCVCSVESWRNKKICMYAIKMSNYYLKKKVGFFFKARNSLMCYCITTQLSKRKTFKVKLNRKINFLNQSVIWCLVLQGISVIFNVALALLKVRTHMYTHTATTLPPQ